MMDPAYLTWKKRCAPTAAYWPCPVVSYGHGDSFEEQHREHTRVVNKYSKAPTSIDGPAQWKKRCTPTAAYWPCPVVSFGPGDSFEERYREHRRTINKYRSSTSYDLRVQGNFRLLRVVLYLLWRRTFRRWYCNYRGELAIREHNKHHIQDTPLSPGGDTDAYTSEPEDEQQSECTFDSDSEATQEYIPSDDDSEPTQVHIPSGGLAAPA